MRSLGAHLSEAAQVPVVWTQPPLPSHYLFPLRQRSVFTGRGLMAVKLCLEVPDLAEMWSKPIKL